MACSSVSDTPSQGGQSIYSLPVTTYIRPSRDDVYLRMASTLAERSTCRRRHVGCILTNQRGVILSTGYNGPPAGDEHCIEYPCPGSDLPSGRGLDVCEAIHAEQNALLACPRVYDVHTCYVTASPCMHCLKMLLNTPCQRIVFLQYYPHTAAEAKWKSRGREWVHFQS